MNDREHGSGDPAAHAPHHYHGVVDPGVLASERGISAVKWSLLGLSATALFQLGIVALSGSVALLADTFHNFGDAATALPLWLAFSLSRKEPSQRFPYGYGRMEDLAGVVIVCIIALTAILSGYESLRRFLEPEPVRHLWSVAAAAMVGFAGNEAVARYRMRVGREISSSALIADGHHARADSLTSLAVLFGAVGAWLGYPLADPVVGLLITAAILRIAWHTGGIVFTRLLDGVDPQVVDEIRQVAGRTPGVQKTSEVRARWLGHRLQAEINVAVAADLTVEQGHAIAREVRHQLLHRLEYLANAVVHVDPLGAAGEDHHRDENHSHDGKAPHSH